MSKWTWDVEDQSRTGLSVRAGDGIRRMRKTVVRRGWHHNKIVGRTLRRLGRFTPLIAASLPLSALEAAFPAELSGGGGSIR